MSKTTQNTVVEYLTEYSGGDAAAIGRLLAYLSPRFDGSPVPEQLLRDIITSPYHDQLVARDTKGVIIGTATLTITIGSGIGRKAWLEDFVVDPNTQGLGVGGQLWDMMVAWSQEHRATNLSFTSNPRRTQAQKFYLARGANVKDTYFFSKPVG